jgi:hypothetical protein
MSETRSGRVGEATKSGKGRRIELSQTAVEALRRHRERQEEGLNHQGKLVFASKKGTPENSKSLFYIGALTSRCSSKPDSLISSSTNLGTGALQYTLHEGPAP